MASNARKVTKKKSSAPAKKSGAAKKKTAAKRPKKSAAPKKVSAKKPAAKKSAVKKPAAKKSAVKKPAKKVRAAKKGASKKRPGTKAFRRRDASGHLNPAYAETLLAKSGAREKDTGAAFLRGARSKDDGVGEEWVETATSGEDESQDVLGQTVSEERGGPFVTTSASVEFASGTDESNPADATREPFPTT